jgi:uncharacterized oligopeptide transporter (OPT) family protein
MSGGRSKPSLAAGLAAAFAFSACGAALLAALSPWLGVATAVRAVVALLGFTYTLYVIGRSGERVGRLTTIVSWLAVAGAGWLAGLPLVGYVLLHVALAWLVRSLYHYAGLLPALADCGLSLLGAAFAVWAAQRSGSAWLAFWCFFLVQAFHVLIPPTLARGPAAPAATDDAFARAHRAAEAAVRRLSASTR